MGNELALGSAELEDEEGEVLLGRRGKRTC